MEVMSDLISNPFRVVSDCNRPFAMRSPVDSAPDSRANDSKEELLLLQQPLAYKKEAVDPVVTNGGQTPCFRDLSHFAVR